MYYKWVCKKASALSISQLFQTHVFLCLLLHIRNTLWCFSCVGFTRPYFISSWWYVAIRQERPLFNYWKTFPRHPGSEPLGMAPDSPLTRLICWDWLPWCFIQKCLYPNEFGSPDFFSNATIRLTFVELSELSQEETELVAMKFGLYIAEKIQ